MKKVSILLILLITTTTMTIHSGHLKDLIMLLSICLLFYLFGFYIIRKMDHYFKRKKFENDFANIFNDEFLSRLKREVAILKIKNELEKISNSKLRSNQSDEDSDKHYENLQ